MNGRFDALDAARSSEGSLGGVAVALAFAVFLVGVLHRDFLVHKILTVHVGNGIVAVFEGGKGDEAVALAEVGFVARDLGKGQ